MKNQSLIKFKNFFIFEMKDTYGYFSIKEYLDKENIKYEKFEDIQVYVEGEKYGSGVFSLSKGISIIRSEDEVDGNLILKIELINVKPLPATYYEKNPYAVLSDEDIKDSLRSVYDANDWATQIYEENTSDMGGLIAIDYNRTLVQQELLYGIINNLNTKISGYNDKLKWIKFSKVSKEAINQNEELVKKAKKIGVEYYDTFHKKSLATKEKQLLKIGKAGFVILSLQSSFDEIIGYFNSEYKDGAEEYNSNLFRGVLLNYIKKEWSIEQTEERELSNEEYFLAVMLQGLFEEDIDKVKSLTPEKIIDNFFSLERIVKSKINDSIFGKTTYKDSAVEYAKSKLVAFFSEWLPSFYEIKEAREINDRQNFKAKLIEAVKVNKRINERAYEIGRIGEYILLASDFTALVEGSVNNLLTLGVGIDNKIFKAIGKLSAADKIRVIINTLSMVLILYSREIAELLVKEDLSVLEGVPFLDFLNQNERYYAYSTETNSIVMYLSQRNWIEKMLDVFEDVKNGGSFNPKNNDYLSKMNTVITGIFSSIGGFEKYYQHEVAKSSEANNNYNFFLYPIDKEKFLEELEEKFENQKSDSSKEKYGFSEFVESLSQGMKKIQNDNNYKEMKNLSKKIKKREGLNSSDFTIFNKKENEKKYYLTYEEVNSVNEDRKVKKLYICIEDIIECSPFTVLNEIKRDYPDFYMNWIKSIVDKSYDSFEEHGLLASYDTNRCDEYVMVYDIKEKKSYTLLPIEIIDSIIEYHKYKEVSGSYEDYFMIGEYHLFIEKNLIGIVGDSEDVTHILIDIDESVKEQFKNLGSYGLFRGTKNQQIKRPNLYEEPEIYDLEKGLSYDEYMEHNMLAIINYKGNDISRIIGETSDAEVVLRKNGVEIVYSNGVSTMQVNDNLYILIDGVKKCKIVDFNNGDFGIVVPEILIEETGNSIGQKVRIGLKKEG